MRSNSLHLSGSQGVAFSGRLPVSCDTLSGFFESLGSAPTLGLLKPPIGLKALPPFLAAAAATATLVGCQPLSWYEVDEELPGDPKLGRLLTPGDLRLASELAAELSVVAATCGLLPVPNGLNVAG